MGFRSVLSTSAYPIRWPEWFIEKHRSYIHFEEFGKAAMYQRGLFTPAEVKTYGELPDALPEDIQKALVEVWWPQQGDRPMDFTMIWLHECGGLTKIEIWPDQILVGDPSGWNIGPIGRPFGGDGNHSYCYGCSELRTR